MADPAPASSNCTTTVCTQVEMRNFDLNAWLSELASSLPLGDGEVIEVGNTVTVTVRWQDERDAATPLDVSVSTSIGS
jgi:hypothetical protein